MMDEIEQNTADQMAAMKLAMLQVAELYHLTFGTPTGQKVMEHLTDMTCGSSLNGNDMMDVNVNVSPTEFMLIREGQDMVVRHINKMIKFYKEQK